MILSFFYLFHKCVSCVWTESRYRHIQSHRLQTEGETSNLFSNTWKPICSTFMRLLKRPALYVNRKTEDQNCVMNDPHSPSWTGGVKLLCSLLVRQQILLYLLSDGSRVNRLCLGGCCHLVSLGSLETSHFTDVTDALYMGTTYGKSRTVGFTWHYCWRKLFSLWAFMFLQRERVDGETDMTLWIRLTHTHKAHTYYKYNTILNKF